MSILNTVIPIFAVISLGILARRWNFMPDAFLGPANRLAYYFAIPAMLFRGIARSDFGRQVNPELVLGTLLPVIMVFLLALLYSAIMRIPARQRGTFIDGSFHGNIGYIGLAVVYYYMGEEALAAAGILGGFVMIVHNALGVVAQQIYSHKSKAEFSLFQLLKTILANPVIVSCILGIVYSLSALPLPLIADKFLTIVGNLALPMALLVIGASLSFTRSTQQMIKILAICLLKLIVLPGLGYALYRYFELSPQQYLPGLILLMMPVATVVFILSSQMNGDEDLAIASISTSTALSALTTTLWLTFVGLM